MSFCDFRFNLFVFLINVLEILLYYFMVARATYYYIITAARAALDGFIISNAEGSTASARKYFIIKRTLFLF